MNKSEYIKLLKDEYRQLNINIVELTKRKKIIHNTLEELLDQEAIERWEAKNDNRESD